MFRIFLAQQRTADQLPVVLALLDRWLTAGSCRPVRCGTSSAEVLDRLIVATQLRYPSVGDVARSRALPVLREAAGASRPARRSSTRRSGCSPS